MAKKKAVKKTAIKKGSAAAKAKMAKVRKAKKNYILVEADRQTKVKTTNSGGYLYPYNVAKDKLKKAMPPGKRISKKTGDPYWEYRVNRSDKKGSLTGLELHNNPQGWANAWINSIKHKGIFIDILKYKGKKIYVPAIKPFIYFDTLTKAKKYITIKLK
jgi:hypothetical protein